MILAENIEYPLCDHNEFACNDIVNQCLPRTAVCDGSPDCENEIDEDDSICKCTSDQVSLPRCTNANGNRLQRIEDERKKSATNIHKNIFCAHFLECFLFISNKIQCFTLDAFKMRNDCVCCEAEFIHKLFVCSF